MKAAVQDNQKERQRNKKQQELAAQRHERREQKKHGIAPRLVVLLSFSERSSSVQLKSSLVGFCEALLDAAGPVTVSPPTLGKKQRFTLVAADVNSVFDVLEACLVADVVVPVVDAVEGVCAAAVKLASVIKAQGMVTVLPVITGMDRVADKNRHATKKGLLADLQYLFPNVTRVLPADEAEGDVVQIFRFLDQARLNDLHFRGPRSFVLAEQVEFEADAAAAVAAVPCDSVVEPELMGTLRVTGYVRGGNGLSADVLVHIPGIGDMQIDRITDASDGRVLHAATAARPSLQSENEPDPFAGGEQTWPTDADVEMAGASEEEQEEGYDNGSMAAAAVRGRKTRRKVPAGMSEYQAAWLADSGDEEDEGEGEGGEGEEEEEEEEGERGGDNEAMEESSGGVDDVEDDPEGAAGLDHMQDDDNDRKGKERDEQLWPDEVEAPGDVPARERFQKYRGLDSFRTSVWDAKENLPVDYSRIFQMENYVHFVKRHTKAVEDTVTPGQRVTLHLRCAARSARLLTATPRPVVVGSLLKHENKISVLHFDVMKQIDFTEPVGSKEELVAFFGLRRLTVTPIFSQHVPGCDKCKYERFLPTGSASMATFYGPITFAPCTITLFRVSPAQPPVLVASGTLRTCNSDLLLIKKIILTAHPGRVHKRTALCRGMFHYPDDVK